jgi:hypothetical protein
MNPAVSKTGLFYFHSILSDKIRKRQQKNRGIIISYRRNNVRLVIESKRPINTASF